ncbi:hypothetical protein [Streptomyces cylindrosporus]|uniref:Lipoprotein n=1 Tax=Streptomyces cylindrosporus TaxID=2927583 RepID=A0ABS9YD33_9ACTN|nr:hypothetical protein [Streptomyces cylindrosporus]MCI3274420.1 hypothetical protein [Streptomyces cylindrosporus]
MRRTALLIATGVLVLAGCGQQDDPPTADPSPLSSDDPRFLPLAAYDMSEADSRVAGEARWTLAKECMVRLGLDDLKKLDVDPVPAWPERPADTGVVTSVLYAGDDYRYGIDDPGEAARYGYHAAQAAYERRYPEKKWTLSEYLALTGQFVRDDDPRTVHGHGIPKRGCLGEAARAIYGEDPQDRKDPILDLESRSLKQGKRDPVWKQADRKWSACMRKAGYRYDTPGDAELGEDRRHQELEDSLTGAPYDPTKPSALEKRTATADARCKRQTGYVRTVHAIDVRVQNQLIAANRSKLEKERRWNEDAAEKARDVLKR